MRVIASRVHGVELGIGEVWFLVTVTFLVIHVHAAANRLTQKLVAVATQ